MELVSDQGGFPAACSSSGAGLAGGREFSNSTDYCLCWNHISGWDMEDGHECVFSTLAQIDFQQPMHVLKKIPFLHSIDLSKPFCELINLCIGDAWGFLFPLYIIPSLAPNNPTPDSANNRSSVREERLHGGGWPFFFE